jgi:hypothetical protein
MMAAVVDAQCELETDRSCLGTKPEILVLSCKGFDFWLCNDGVSGRGGIGPRKPSGMPREYTLMVAREEACSERGGSVLDIQILGAIAFTDLLPSEQVP